MMIRSFLPVGQGAFYCECFNIDDKSKINVVYDCGSSTDEKIVEKEIENNFEKGEVIHALFISHLDEDHVNGIPYLLNHCKVEKIFFPLITEKDKTALKIYYEITGKMGFVYEFLNSPYHTVYSYVDYKVELIGVKPYIGYETEDDDNGEINIAQEDIAYVNSGDDVGYMFLAQIKSFTYKNEFEWKYIPFNFRRNKKIKNLYYTLKLLFGKDITADDLSEVWKKGTAEERKLIKNAYEEIPGELNSNSMTLFSGDMYLNTKQYMYDVCVFCSRCAENKKFPSGCLYTGDYEAGGSLKWKELRKAYDLCWSNIGCIQLPHHGARKNFNEKFADMDCCFIMSAGYNSQYRHPSSSVIKILLSKGKYYCIVTEQVGSRVNFVVEI